AADRAAPPVPPLFVPCSPAAGGPAGPNPPVLDPVPPALCGTSITVTGHADPGVRVQVTGGATVATTVAASDGRFSVVVGLNPDQVNSLAFVAIDAQNRTSTATTLSVRNDCTPPRVETAALEGDTLVITFSEAMDPATVALGGSGSVSLAGRSEEHTSELQPL